MTDGTQESSLPIARRVAVVHRSSVVDRYAVTRLYSRLLATGMRRRGSEVREIDFPEPPGTREFVDTVLDPTIDAIYLTTPTEPLDALFDAGLPDISLAPALRAKRFVILVGNPAFNVSSSHATTYSLDNARFVHIDADSLEYVADGAGRRDHLAHLHLPGLVAAYRPAPLHTRRRMFLFAATVRDPAPYRAAWCREQPHLVELFDALTDQIQSFDASAWRIARDLIAMRDLPFTVHDDVGARLVVLANTFVYHAGKQALLRRIRRFPVAYVVEGGPMAPDLAAGSEFLGTLANDRLLTVIAKCRANIWYPPNRMIGATTSRVPNTLTVGTIPIAGITPAIAALPDLIEGMLGFDHRYDGLEDAMERLIARPQDFQAMADAGPSLATRHFNPERFVDAMIALAN